MPQNPFTKYQNYVTKPPRNSVDLSFRNNGTFSLGTVTPVCCLEVNPGETFSIESAFGLKFFPMPFPVQTPMNASLHFYYVRNRTMWKDWVDFIYRNKSHDVIPHPTLNRPASDKEFWKTGGLADRLGVPTVVVGDDGNAMQFAAGYGLNYSTAPVGVLSPVTNNSNLHSQSNGSNQLRIEDPRSLVLAKPDFITNVRRLSDILSAPFHFRIDVESEYFIGYMYGGFASMPVVSEGTFKLVLNGCQIRVAATENIEENLEVWCFYSETGDLSDPSVVRCFDRLSLDSVDGWSVGSTSIELNVKYDDPRPVPEVIGNGKYFFFVCQDKVAWTKDSFFYVPDTIVSNGVTSPATSAQISVLLSNAVDISSDGTLNPFAGPDPVLPLSALPFRAYEMVYNAWIRNERLEPLMIDGVPEYNKFCPNMESGADAYPYKMYQRNWESDFLTSALPTPQQGIAPVVGVTGLTNVQIQDPENQKIYNFTAEVDGDDGETITGGSFHDPGVPEAVRKTAQELVIAGFTINDFRNVNALQRWCENNLRRGLKYRDQVLANTGVKVKYDELDMPEFIGGFSRPVQVTSVTQTTPGGDLGLGDYAGQANCFGSSKHRITHYCDEAGFIIGVLTVTPMPVYSQLLPKMFLKRTALDYHHPVFNHIGPQPITYGEVCPLQVFYKNPTQDSTKGITFNDVFGYQRPFYDLLAHVDEVHGQMRTTLRKYVMNRTFADVPELGADFIHVDPKQLNQVFNMTLEDEDVIMGEILFRIYAKRPVSLFGQPKIQ